MLYTIVCLAEWLWSLNLIRELGFAFLIRRVDSAFYPIRVGKMRISYCTTGDCCRRLHSSRALIVSCGRKYACRWQVTLCNPMWMLGSGALRLC